MGIISGLITYNLGKRRGRRDSENAGPGRPSRVWAVAD